MSEPNQDILVRVQKLLNLAANNNSPAEAAAAAAKAQALMEEHNLSTAMLEKNAGVDGKRLKDAVAGGHYTWQRELWGSVARLNFCLYWTQEYKAVRTRTERSIINPSRVYYKGDSVTKKRHVLVGRVANVASTKAMAEYLEQAISRLSRERLTDSTGKLNSGDYNGAFGISFREGAADDIMSRLNKERRIKLATEARKAKAAKANASSGTGLVLSTYIDEETDANMDFIHGAGWSAEQARSKMERAREREEEERAYTAWAEANPEEAKKAEEEERKRARRRGGYGGASPKEKSRDWGAYNAGSEAGKRISLSPQMDNGGSAKRIAGKKDVYL